MHEKFFCLKKCPEKIFFWIIFKIDKTFGSNGCSEHIFRTAVCLFRSSVPGSFWPCLRVGSVLFCVLCALYGFPWQSAHVLGFLALCGVFRVPRLRFFPASVSRLTVPGAGFQALPAVAFILPLKRLFPSFVGLPLPLIVCGLFCAFLGVACLRSMLDCQSVIVKFFRAVCVRFCPFSGFCCACLFSCAFDRFKPFLGLLRGQNSGFQI